MKNTKRHRFFSWLKSLLKGRQEVILAELAMPSKCQLPDDPNEEWVRKWELITEIDILRGKLSSSEDESLLNFICGWMHYHELQPSVAGLIGHNALFTPFRLEAVREHYRNVHRRLDYIPF